MKYIKQPAVYVSFTHPVAPLRSAADFRRYLVLQLLLDCVSSRLFKV